MVSVINLDGLTLVGGGSEWFWSMLQFVIVAITLVAIYRQVRLQASTAAIDQATALQAEWHSSERFNRSRLAILLALQHKLDPATSARAACSEIGNFWERVGFLVRAGHIQRRLVFEYFSNSVQLWWAWLAPTIRTWRVHEQDPLIFEHFEWLASSMGDLDRAKGPQRVLDDAYLAVHLAGNIQSSLDLIAREEEIRAVAFRPMSPAPPDEPHLTVAPE